MKTDKRKIVIVGTGMVGMSYAYCLLNQSVCDELVLIDVDKKRAEGEAMDLNHGLAFAGSSMKIYAGEYKELPGRRSGGDRSRSGPEAGRNQAGSVKAKHTGISFDYRAGNCFRI